MIIGEIIIGILLFVVAIAIANNNYTGDLGGYSADDVRTAAIVIGIVYIVVALIQIIFMVSVYWVFLMCHK